MFVNREVYEYRIGNLIFKSNSTKGITEVYDESGRIIKFIKKTPQSYSDFQTMAFSISSNMEEDK
ncbi:hypothetical protein [Clostridium sp. DL1XJH146]